MNHAFITANLNLYAVLPRLKDLVRLDPKARAIAEKMDLGIQFLVGSPTSIGFKNGDVRLYSADPTRSLYLSIRKGVVSAGPEKTGKVDVGLYFTSSDKLNRMFDGQKVIPIPFKGLHKLGRMKDFEALTERMTEILKPSDENMKDPAFRAMHVEMTLLVGLNGARQIAEFDPKAKKLVTSLPDGTLQFSVLPDGPHAYASLVNRRISAGPGRVEQPSASIEIISLDLAVDLLAGKVDTFAANGAGDIKASGLLPLADEFNAVMDRVGLFLN